MRQKERIEMTIDRSKNGGKPPFLIFEIGTTVARVTGEPAGVHGYQRLN
jgi:hypothetical protein